MTKRSCNPGQKMIVTYKGCTVRLGFRAQSAHTVARVQQQEPCRLNLLTKAGLMTDPSQATRWNRPSYKARVLCVCAVALAQPVLFQPLALRLTPLTAPAGLPMRLPSDTRLSALVLIALLETGRLEKMSPPAWGASCVARWGYSFHNMV